MPSCRSFSPTRLLREKLVLLALMSVVFGALYSGAQRIDLRPVTWLPLDPRLTEAFPVNFNAVYLYLSLYPLMGLAAFVIMDRGLLWRFGIGLGWLGVVSAVFFILFPTGVLRPDPTGSPALYQFVIMMDAPRNAFPSLHASQTIACAIFIHRFLGQFSWAWATRASLWFWVAGIFWSCIALRQHTGIDLVGGGLLGLATGWLALEAPGLRNKEEEPEMGAAA